jgi:hypothetical protein
VPAERDPAEVLREALNDLYHYTALARGGRSETWQDGRQALASLVAEVERLRKEQEAYRVALHEMYHSYDALIAMSFVTREQAMQWDGPICARRLLEPPPLREGEEA